jgi:hypothetical protein
VDVQVHELRISRHGYSRDQLDVVISEGDSATPMVRTPPRAVECGAPAGVEGRTTLRTPTGAGLVRGQHNEAGTLAIN